MNEIESDKIELTRVVTESELRRRSTRAVDCSRYNGQLTEADEQQTCEEESKGGRENVYSPHSG